MKTVKLGDICLKITDGSHNPPKAAANGEFMMLSSRNIQDDKISFENIRLLSKEDFEQENKRTDVQPGDVLLTIVGTIGRTIVVPEDLPKFTLQRSVAVIKPDKELLDSHYLMFHLRSKIKFLTDSARGVAQKGIYLNQIKDLEIDLPPIEEQRRIVARLDASFEKIARAEALMKQNLDNVAALQKSILHKYLSASDSTHTHRLGDLLIIERGGSPRPIKDFITTEANGINWIKIGDVKPDAKYITSTKEKIKPEGLKKSRKVEVGDFVLSNSMSFGRPYIMKTAGAIHDGWLLLRQKDNTLDKDFLYYFLSSDEAYKQFDKYAAGSTVRNLNTQSVAKVEIRYPADVEKQKEIARKLDMAGEEAERLQVLYTKKLTKLTNLRQSLLQEAFSIT